MDEIKEKIEKIYNILKYESTEKKKKVYIELMTQKTLLPEFLRKARSRDYQDRLCFAQAAAYIKAENMLGLLFGYLKDENKYVRQEASKALGEMGFKKAIPYLSQTMYSDDSYIVWTKAAVALHKLGEKKGQKMLVENYDFEDPENTEPSVIEALLEIDVKPEKKKLPCYIVTACRGRRSEEVFVLSLWRDLFLADNDYGKILIRIYNFIGPYLADIAERSKILRSVFLVFTVKPIFFVVKKYFKLSIKK